MSTTADRDHVALGAEAIRTMEEVVGGVVARIRRWQLADAVAAFTVTGLTMGAMLPEGPVAVLVMGLVVLVIALLPAAGFQLLAWQAGHAVGALRDAVHALEQLPDRAARAEDAARLRSCTEALHAVPGFRQRTLTCLVFGDDLRDIARGRAPRSAWAPSSVVKGYLRWAALWSSSVWICVLCVAAAALTLDLAVGALG